MFCKKKEDTKHYLLVCPSFAAQRVEIFQSLVYIQPDIATFVNKSNERNKLCLKLLFGINDFEQDKILFEIVEKYIKSTKRFNKV